jgi:hypothetical protein
MADIGLRTCDVDRMGCGAVINPGSEIAIKVPMHRWQEAVGVVYK